MLFILLWHLQGIREKEGSGCSKRKATIETRGCKEEAQGIQTAHERRPGKEEILTVTSVPGERCVGEGGQDGEQGLWPRALLQAARRWQEWKMESAGGERLLLILFTGPYTGGSKPDVKPWGKCAFKWFRPYSGTEKGAHNGKMDAVSIQSELEWMVFPSQVHLQAWRPWRWWAARLQGGGAPCQDEQGESQHQQGGGGNVGEPWKRWWRGRGVWWSRLWVDSDIKLCFHMLICLKIIKDLDILTFNIILSYCHDVMCFQNRYFDPSWRNVVQSHLSSWRLLVPIKRDETYPQRDLHPRASMGPAWAIAETVTKSTFAMHRNACAIVYHSPGTFLPPLFHL